MTDLQIAKGVSLKHISSIAQKFGIDPEQIEMFGKYKAKLPLKAINREKTQQSNLVLVSAISPTPAGEGKTTMSIGLSEGLNRLGKKSTVILREPSLGPVFGIKGGATGGGHYQVMDMNDRSLRHVIVGLGGTTSGVPRETGFDITAASEIMAILCLAESLSDLKTRLGNIFVGYTYDKKPIYANDLKAEGAMAALLKDAIKPNLVQTIEGNPAIIHGGPFANIAQGTNSVIATLMGMSHSEYTVTEAGFGFDLGAEKFFDQTV